MKTVMTIVGSLLMIPFVLLEVLVKIAWAVIYSIIRPAVKNLWYNDAMYDYAFKWKYKFIMCDWIINLWR